MSLKAMMAADIAAVFFNDQELAKHGNYNGVDILVIPQIGEGESRSDPDNRREMAYFRFKTDDVPNPEIGDVFTYDGKDWYFAEITSKNDFSIRCRFFADQSAVILR